jgi:hypothetical protein
VIVEIHCQSTTVGGSVHYAGVPVFVWHSNLEPELECVRT